MNTHRGVTPIVWVLIAAIVLAGGYLLYQKGKSKSENGATQPTPSALSSEGTVGWKTYHNKEYGVEFKYPVYWKQTSIFSGLGGYANAVAFTKSSKEAQLQKALIPDSDVGAVVIQGNAFFLKPTSDEPLFLHLEENRTLLKASEAIINGEAVLYLIHSVKTDPNTFAGGSTEVYVFKDRGFVVEADYPSVEPAGELKNTLDQILSTFRFTK